MGDACEKDVETISKNADQLPPSSDGGEAKHNLILDIKPWDDETDMSQLEQAVRNITIDGLFWGASRLIPLAYGIQKFQISCVLQDDIIPVEQIFVITEAIEELSDFVQSVEIASFQDLNFKPIEK